MSEYLEQPLIGTVDWSEQSHHSQSSKQTLDLQTTSLTNDSHKEERTSHAHLANVCPDMRPPLPMVPTDFEIDRQPLLNSNIDLVDHGSGNIFQYDPFAAPHFDSHFGNQAPFAMPEDFIQYLFHGIESSPSNINSATSWQEFELQDHGPALVKQSLAKDATDAHNILASSSGSDYTTGMLTEARSQDIYRYIYENLSRNVPEVSDEMTTTFFSGDRTSADHILSRESMQSYIEAYWVKIDPKIPLLHKPTFSPDSTPDHLMVAVITLGASSLNQREQSASHSNRHKLAELLAWHLRWDIFRSSNTCEGDLQTFQALCLLEVYEKMHSSRALHERAHVHHATAITLMRRGTFLGLASVQSMTPSTEQPNGLTACLSNAAEVAWYHGWIYEESVRRVACTAFMIDSSHAAMFGHSMIMATHELRLIMPCDSKLWKAENASELMRIEATLRPNGTRRKTFAEGLRETLNGHRVHTGAFGHSLLLCGLLSVSWQMKQRDMQLSSLNKDSGTKGKEVKWRRCISNAIDAWGVTIGRHDTTPTDEHGVVANTASLFRLAQFYQDVDIVECQIFAGARKVLGRPIGRSECEKADSYIRKTWAPSAEARQATFSAIRLLCAACNDITINDGNDVKLPIHGTSPEALWIVYMAALITWCYSFAADGPSQSISSASTLVEHVRNAKTYLRRLSHVEDADEICHYRLNACGSLLWVLCRVFRSQQWALLHEGADLLLHCRNRILSN